MGGCPVLQEFPSDPFGFVLEGEEDEIISQPIDVNDLTRQLVVVRCRSVRPIVDEVGLGDEHGVYVCFLVHHNGDLVASASSCGGPIEYLGEIVVLLDLAPFLVQGEESVSTGVRAVEVDLHHSVYVHFYCEGVSVPHDLHGPVVPESPVCEDIVVDYRVWISQVVLVIHQDPGLPELPPVVFPRAYGVVVPPSISQDNADVARHRA